MRLLLGICLLAVSIDILVYFLADKTIPCITSLENGETVTLVDVGEWIIILLNIGMSFLLTTTVVTLLCRKMKHGSIGDEAFDAAFSLISTASFCCIVIAVALAVSPTTTAAIPAALGSTTAQSQFAPSWNTEAREEIDTIRCYCA